MQDVRREVFTMAIYLQTSQTFSPTKNPITWYHTSDCGYAHYGDKLYNIRRPHMQTVAYVQTCVL